jgi:NCS1 family nucleobase:cation symporter-1
VDAASAEVLKRSARSSRVEVRSIDQIPSDERHGRVRDQFTLWFGLNANVFQLVLGGVVVFMGLDLFWASIAIVTGVVIGLVLVGFHAIQGPQLGVPQMIQSRGQFGFYGAVLVFAASICLDFGFLAAQLVIQAEAMHLLVGSVSIAAWIAILTVPVVVLAIYGYDWIHRWQRWMTVILSVTFAVVLIQALTRGAPVGGAAGEHPPSFALFLGATGLFVIDMVSYAPYVSDYSRYLPKNVDKTRTFWAVFIGAAVPTIFCGILGAYITGLLPEQTSTVAAVADVSGNWVLLILAVSLIGSDAINAYTGMLALASILSCFRRVERAVWVRVIGSLLIIGAGTISALLGYEHFVENLANFLNVLLYVFIPWSAINLTDYYFVRHGEYDVASFFTAKGRYGGFMWPGLTAYVLSVAVQIPFIDQTFYTGSLVKPLGGADISWLVGGVAGVVFYLIALRVRPVTGAGELGAAPGPLSTPERVG